MSQASDRAGARHTAVSQSVIATVIGLVIALFGIQLFGLLEVPARLAGTPAAEMLLGSASNWLVVAVLLLLVRFWERLPLASLGLRRPSVRQALAAAGVGLGAVVAGLLVTGAAVSLFGLEQPVMVSRISQVPFAGQLFIVLTAVITEEILWRGYAIERLTELSGRLWIGAVASGVVFLAVHFRAWGLAGAIPQAVFTVALVALYARTRNTVSAMIAQLVINAVMVLLLPNLV